MPGYLLNDVCRKYTVSKLTFLRTLIEQTKNQKNFNNFIECNIFGHLKPFLNDSSVEVQNETSLLLARSAQFGSYLTPNIIDIGIISELLRNIWHKDHTYQVNTLKVLTDLGAHSEISANVVLDVGGLEHLEAVFSSFDKVLLSHAVYAAGKLGSYPQTALKFSNTLHLLHSLLQSTDVTFVTNLVAALGDIAAVSEEMSHQMAKNIFSRVTKLLSSPSIALKETVLAAVARFASHTPELSIEVAKTGVLPEIIKCLSITKGRVRTCAIDALIQISKHNEQTAGILLLGGGIPAIKNVINKTSKLDRQKCVELLGILSKYPHVAKEIYTKNVIPSLMSILHAESNVEMIMSIIWTLGELGKNSHEISSQIANENLLPVLIQYLKKPNVFTCYSVLMNTFKSVYQNCVDERMMRIFQTNDVNYLPHQVIEHVVANLSVYLPLAPTARMKFLESGALKHLMSFDAIDTETFTTNRNKIISCYPENIIRDTELRAQREQQPTVERAPPPPWLPRPMRAVGVDWRPPVFYPQNGEWERAVAASPTGWTSSTAPGRRGPRLFLRQPSAPAPTILLPPLHGSDDVGLLPVRVSCEACCLLATPQDHICCLDVGPEQATLDAHLRSCHVLLQGQSCADADDSWRRPNADEGPQDRRRASDRESTPASPPTPDATSTNQQEPPLFELVIESSDSDTSNTSKLTCCSSEEHDHPRKSPSQQRDSASYNTMVDNMSGAFLIS